MYQRTGCFLSGCLTWIGGLVGIPLLVIFLLVSFVTGPSREQAAVNKVQAEAERTQAQAAMVQAEAVVIQAEAQADVLKMYTRAGVNAIETDRKRAHPETMATETLVKVLLILCVPLCLALVTLAVIWYRDPETGRRIVGALSALRPKRAPKVDGDYRDGAEQKEEVSL